jgi:hypothetical protein
LVKEFSVDTNEGFGPTPTPNKVKRRFSAVLGTIKNKSYSLPQGDFDFNPDNTAAAAPKSALGQAFLTVVEVNM